MGRGTVNPMQVAGNSDCSSDLVLEEEDVEIKLVFTGQMFRAKINKKLAAQIVDEKKNHRN